jgi:hypothetical protein
MSNDATVAPAPPSSRTDPRSLSAPASLEPLQEFRFFQKRNRNVFPSMGSIHWFYQKHRGELIESGAVVELAGRRLINSPIFAQKTLEIGTRAATARTQR